MIVYKPLWALMKERGYSTYTLRSKLGMGSSQVQRLKHGGVVTTKTLDDLCKFLNCELQDIAAFEPDGEPPWPQRGEQW